MMKNQAQHDINSLFTQRWSPYAYDPDQAVSTEDLQGIVELSDRQEIIADEAMKTSIPGVFAAGDCIVKRYRQVTTAVADGTIAALSAAEYLRS